MGTFLKWFFSGAKDVEFRSSRDHIREVSHHWSRQQYWGVDRTMIGTSSNVIYVKLILLDILCSSDLGFNVLIQSLQPGFISDLEILKLCSRCLHWWRPGLILVFAPKDTLQLIVRVGLLGKHGTYICVSYQILDVFFNFFWSPNSFHPSLLKSMLDYQWFLHCCLRVSFLSSVWLCHLSPAFKCRFQLWL